VLQSIQALLPLFNMIQNKLFFIAMQNKKDWIFAWCKRMTIASIRQWLLGLGGSGLLLSILFLHNSSPSISTIAIFTIISWLCIVASEALGKTAFYEARRQPGLAYPELPWSSSSKD